MDSGNNYSKYFTKINAYLFAIGIGFNIFNAYVISEIPMKIAMGLMGNSTLFVIGWALDFLQNLRKDIERFRSEKFSSNEEKIKKYRTPYHFYWVTVYEGKQSWRHATYDFSLTKISGKLSAVSKELDPDGNLRQYQMSAIIRGSRLVITKSPVSGTEQPGISIFPDFTIENDDKECGIRLAESYDKKVDGVFPIIISKGTLFKWRKLGKVDLEESQQLWRLWDNKFNPKRILKESLKHLGKIEHADVIQDIKASHLWRKIRGDFYFYNALWTLTGDGFVEDFKFLLNDKYTTKWKIIYFSEKDQSSENAKRATERQKRMYNSIIKILSPKDTLKTKSIQIREAHEDNEFPNITFFLFKDENNTYVSRIYIYELMNLKNDVPEIAFDVYGEETYRNLKRIFDSAFEHRTRQVSCKLKNRIMISPCITLSKRNSFLIANSHTVSD